MKDKLRLHKLGNMLMLVMLLGTIFAPTMYNASEVASEVRITQESSIEEEDVVSETSEAVSEEVASEETEEVVKSEEDSEAEANAPPVEESEVASETNEAASEEETSNTDTTSEVATEDTEDDVIDLTNMSKDEIVKALDPNSEEQNFITLNAEELKQTRGVSLTEVKSSEDFSVINSTMYGEWAIYKANGHFIFCIEPGVDSLSVADETTQSGSIFNSFSTTTKRYVGRVISSSMQHYADSSNTDYVFAGQLLIWDYLSDHERSALGDPMPGNPYFLDSWTIHNSSKYGTEIDKIESDINDWNVRPSFMGSTESTAKKHTLKYNATKDNFELTLTDTNGVWDSKFANYGDFGDYTVTNPAGANNIKITTSVEHTSYTSAKNYVWTPYASGKAEFYDAGQDLVYVGSDPVHAYMKFNTEARPLGGFTAKKVDSETGQPLKGAVFGLYDDSGNKVASYTSNSNGILSSGGMTLDNGHYTLKETKAPTGYVKPNTEYSVTIKAGEITDYTSKPFKNTMIKGGFELTKLGEIFQLEPEELAGVDFRVTSTTYPDFNKVYTTDENGQIITADDELKYGDYHIEEINAPSDYVIDFEQDFSIKKDGVIVQLNGGDDIVNNLYLNKVHAVKMAENFNNEDNELYPLAGSTFGIYEEIGEPNGQIDKQDHLIDMQTTDENGEFTSIGLPQGSYIVKEIEPTEGYNINANSYPFTIANDGTLETGSVIDLGEIENEVITAKAQLIKVGSKLCDKEMARPDAIKDCQTLLPGVSFAVYQDLNNNGVFDKNESKPVDVMTTDNDGLAVSNDLKFGHYFVKEINNPADNYFMNDNVFEFTIDEQDEMVMINNGVAIENIEKLGNIHITKSGNAIGNLNDDTVMLGDAEYTIYNSKGEVEDVLTTDSNGEATSIMLSFGDYTMQETKAPEGYALDDTKYEFTIDNETYENTIEFDLNDEVIENEVSILKTDLASGDELPGAELNVIEDNGTGTIVDTWTSTTEAHIINLEYGDYIITETLTPEGYLPLAEAVKFSVTEDGIKQDFKIDNELITNEIHIKKVDVATGEEIPGAHLQIIDRNSEEVVDKWVSTEEEHVSTVPYGNYAICEQIAPIGYQRKTTCVNFDVTEDGIIQTFKIENELIKQMAVTGGDPVKYAVVGGLAIILVGAFAAKRKLKTSK